MKTRIFWAFVGLALLICGQAYAGDLRIVPLEGVKNTRDLGGLETQDGRTVKSGLLLRSGEIDHISDAGIAKLNEIGITAVIDLRTTKEATADPAVWPEGTGPTRYNFAMLERQSEMIDDMRHRIKTGTAEAEWMDRTFSDTFDYMPTDYSAEIRQVFDVLLSAEPGELILYHCSGGKDRTGVVTAVLLSALGVKREDIEADFLLSNTLIQADTTALALAEQINRANGTSIAPEDVWPSLGVRPEYLEVFYTSLQENYGGMDGYLKEELRLTSDDLMNLRDKYLAE